MTIEMEYWYQASAGAGLSKGTSVDSSTLSTETNIELGDTPVHLIANSTDTLALSNVNGAALETKAWDQNANDYATGDESAALIGTVTISAAFDNVLSNPELFNDQTTSIVLKGKGQVKLCTVTGGGAWSADTTNNKITVYIKVVSGVVKVSLDGTNFDTSVTYKFRVQASNPTGYEAAHSGDGFDFE